MIQRKRIDRLKIVAFAKEVKFSSALVCLFVRLLAGSGKNYPTNFHKFDEKLAHEPRKKPLDIAGNRDHVTLGLG